MIKLPKDQKPGESGKATVRELREEQANGISETRMVVAGGQIIASRGFTVAGDKRSALLEPSELLALLKRKPVVELFLEWEVDG